MLSEQAELFIEGLVSNGITVEDVLYAIEIAKDEEVRVIWQRIVKKTEQVSRGNELEFKGMASLGRKMFQHHADGKSYPWKLDDLRNGKVNEKEVEDYLGGIEDPDPKSQFARPRHT